jgi:hypothetical protein
MDLASIQSATSFKDTIFLKPFRWCFRFISGSPSMIFVFILSLAFVFNACEYESMTRYNLGDDFLDDPTKVLLIDTITVHTSTIMMDTIPTSQGSRILSGRCKDLMGVETFAEGYFRIAPPAIPTFHESAEFDSANFILYLDGYRYGDTTRVARYNIYYLDEDMRYNRDTRSIYQNTRFKSKSEIFASFSINLDDNHDSILVKIPQDEARKYYDMVYNESSLITSADSFKNEFKGFVIQPADMDVSFVAGFVVNPDSAWKPKIRVYYHDNQLDNNFKNKKLSFDYPLLSKEDSCKYYVSSYIKNNFEGTSFEGLVPGETSLPSANTGEITMIQSGINIRTKIDIPYIDNLYDLGYGSIIKAELIFEPIDDLYNDLFKLPQSFTMFLLDKRNRQQSSTPLPIIDTENTTSIAYLYQNSVFANQAVYKFDVTRYVKDEYDSKAVSSYKLALSIPASAFSTSSFKMDRTINNSVDRVYIGSPNNKQSRMKLKVYMSIN